MRLAAQPHGGAAPAGTVAPAWWLLLGLGALTTCALAASGVQAPRLLVLLLLAPLLEEAVFRAGLQEGLLRRWAEAPALWANLATAAAFGLAHVLVRGDANAAWVALPALLIGLVYQRRHRLRESVALHAVMNAAWLGWAQLGPALPGATAR